MPEEIVEELFFSKFKEIRKSKNLSTNDVVKIIKIQEQYIHAIELGQFEKLPKVYSRLFIKSYCNCIGLNSEDILISYEKYLKADKKSIKKSTNNKTPHYIENKSSVLNNESSTNNHLNNYFIGSGRIIATISVLGFILICWLTLSYISKQKFNENQIVFNNTLLEWNFFDSLNLFDTETININNIIENNIFYYKTNTLKNKLIIKDFNDVNILNKILVMNDENQISHNSNIQFGILNNDLQLYINGQKINFKHTNKSIIGIFDIQTKQIKIKYFE